MSEKNKDNHYKVVRGNILSSQEEIFFKDKPAQLRREFSFLNYSGIDLWICFPEGMYVLLKAGENTINTTMKRPDNSTVYNSLIIEHEVSVNRQSTNSNDIRIQWIDGNEDKNIQELRKRFNDNSKIRWFEEIPMTQLTKSMRGSYVSSCDVVITLNEAAAQRFHHFRCVQRIRNDYMIAANDVNLNNSLHMYIRLIDNNGLLGDQWTIFHNQVIKLKAKQDAHVASGLYIAGLLKEGVMEESLVDEDLFYTLDELRNGEAPIKVFSSREEALIEKNKPYEKLLDIKTKEKDQEHKRLMDERDKEHEMRILAQKEKNAELERKLIEYDKEVKMAKMLREEEYDRRKNDIDEEAMYRKDKYESRHDNNKAMVEAMKTAGIILSAGLAFAAFTRK